MRENLKLNDHTDVFSKDKCLSFDLSFHQHPYFALCVQAAKALASLRIYADTPEPSMLANAISTDISCNVLFEEMIRREQFVLVINIVKLLFKQCKYNGFVCSRKCKTVNCPLSSTSIMVSSEADNNNKKTATTYNKWKLSDKKLYSCITYSSFTFCFYWSLKLSRDI